MCVRFFRKQATPIILRNQTNCDDKSLYIAYTKESAGIEMELVTISGHTNLIWSHHDFPANVIHDVTRILMPGY